ncbi:MAG: flagellar type III secretion system pore protein FliP [Lachnospiraceae bacterium]|nr:flagellar type III secretion system pore protein FliP [Lachnospiraceae bacterium]
MNKVLRSVCLLLTVGILFIVMKVPAYAGEMTTGTDSHLAGETEQRTYINDSGTAGNPSELNELNISNELTVTYNNGNGELSGSLRILLTLTLIALAPLLLIMLTSFTRIIIVLHFTRSALNTTTAPPNNVLIALALILTFFIMNKTLTTAYNESIVPLDKGEVTQQEALERGLKPFREFMYGQTQIKDVEMFMEIAGEEWDGESLEDIPNYILIPSFAVSELRSAFIIGFIIYIPFIVIDMIVASILMSMGMMMLPPTTISMPFKILLFVLADGWNLIIMGLVRSF